MDLSPLEYQPTLDDAYYVIEELLPFIQPNEFEKLPEHVTDEIEFYREGGLIAIQDFEKFFTFFPLYSGKWLVRVFDSVDYDQYVYVIDKEDIMSWIVSSSADPDNIKVILDFDEPEYTIYGYKVIAN